MAANDLERNDRTVAVVDNSNSQWLLLCTFHTSLDKAAIGAHDDLVKMEDAFDKARLATA
jgi:hypothetical protein